jgi:carbohydrate kinase (thermoresistant glucokinase family)
MSTENKIYFVMGVAGCGKTTVGQMLASRLGIDFYDGDAFHTEVAISKMAAGIPLADEDRYAWLQTLNQKAATCLALGVSAVIACSALKESYRQLLTVNLANQFVWIYLHGDFNTIFKRMQQRKNHFMPASLLQSQFDILEEPVYAIRVGVSDTPGAIVQTIMEQLQ